MKKEKYFFLTVVFTVLFSLISCGPGPESSNGSEVPEVTYTYTARCVPRSPVVNEKAYIFMSFPFYNEGTYYNRFDYPFVLEITDPDGEVEVKRSIEKSISCVFTKVGTYKCKAYTWYLEPARENYEWDFEVIVRASEEDDIS